MDQPAIVQRTLSLLSPKLADSKYWTLLDIREYFTSFFNGYDNCFEVVIGKYHVWSSFRNTQYL